MAKGAPIRIGFLHTHPIQYVAPLYQHLNRHWEASITALYLSDYSVRGGADRGFGRGVQWDIDLVEGYDARFVRGAERRGEPAGFFSVVAPPALARNPVRRFRCADRARPYPGGDGACRRGGKGVAHPGPDALRNASRVAAIPPEAVVAAAADRRVLSSVRCRSGDRVRQPRILPRDGRAGRPHLSDALRRR